MGSGEERFKKEKTTLTRPPINGEATLRGGKNHKQRWKKALEEHLGKKSEVGSAGESNSSGKGSAQKYERS